MDFSVKIISTLEWNSRSAKSIAQQTTPTHIVIHHTATAPSSNGTEIGGKKLAQSIQNYHMNHNGWIDSGHNFLNTVGGIVFEGRHGTVDALKIGKCVLSAHCGNELGNASPGIENEGIYMTQKMSQIQWEALVALCADICLSCRISPEKIRGHRDFSSTACPGDWLYAQLPLLIKQVKDQLAARR